MIQPRVLVFSGYGLNCEEETQYAFQLAGAKADIIHINDLIDGYVHIKQYQILVFPGGFSYGDDTGSGGAFANKLRNHLWDDIKTFVQKDCLIIGICNGFQILTRLGLLPAFEKQYGNQEIALLHNESARYVVRWVDLKVKNDTPWLKHMDTVSLPIAHGEGKLYTPKKYLNILKKKHMIALKYVKGEICNDQNLPANPTGTLDNIAGITDESKKILGIMPHPERAIFFTQLPHWTYLKEQYQRQGKEIPLSGPGLQIFKNGVFYFQ